MDQAAAAARWLMLVVVVIPEQHGGSCSRMRGKESDWSDGDAALIHHGVS